MTLQLLTVVLLSFVPTSSASAASDMNVSYILFDSIPWLSGFAIQSEAQARMETFTYRGIGPDTYWYAWHVRASPSPPLVLGDSATCRRKG